MAKFVHLHTHSHYSLLDGLGKIPELVKRAKELDMTALALTDHGVMYGAIEFYQECIKAGIKPIIGAELYLAQRTLKDKTPKIDSSPYHQILLAKNFAGYQNLMKLTSIGYLQGFYYKPRIDLETLAKYSEGLIGTSACLAGIIPQKALSGDMAGAKKAAKQLSDIFGKDNFYLELQYHPNLDGQKKANELLIKIARELSLPLVATNDIHYVRAKDKETHEVLLAVNTGKDLDDKDRMTLSDIDLYMEDEEFFKTNFKNVPEVIENTARIANACNLEIPLDQKLLPHFKVPTNQTDAEYLRDLCEEGLKKRYSIITSEIEKRLDYELDTINQMGFASYFLIVADIVSWAKNQGILCGPRGSAASALVAYVLNIADIDPLKYNMPFERFLNPDRISMPDIDMDFPDDRRAEIIQYVRDKYGDDHVAGIITYGTMMSRAAVRDVGRALGIPYGEVDTIAKLVPPPIQGRYTPLQESIKNSPELKSIYESNPQTKRLLDLASNIEGTVRHASQHACAVVISKDPLTEYVPLQPAQKGDVGQVTQYSMKPIETLGLLKMDFLGLANLTILANTIRIIEAIHQKEINLQDLPLDDKKTYNLLGRGETTGVFQLESAGMKRYIKELKPTSISEIAIMVALYRPGPMQFIESFINRRHGKERIEYMHPLTENALKETYGIPIYQEQVMQISKDMAGFTGGQADTLRKAMGKKIAKLMKEMKLKFIEGSISNGVSKDIAITVFNQLEDFAAYGFNKSHAICYAYIAYQTAYLKAHYPACFMAALLTSDYQNLDRITIEIEECNRMGMEVLAPNVNESFVEFGVLKETNNISFGLAAIKNVGVGVAKAIVDERKVAGSYQSIEDFASRLGTNIMNKKVLEALIKSGALDCFGERNQLLAGVELILKFTSNFEKMLSSSQLDLFTNTKIRSKTQSVPFPQVTSADKKQILAWEKELLGIYLSDHPLKAIQNILPKIATPINQLSDKVGSIERIGGIITTVKKIMTKNNQPMIFMKLEDLSSNIEVVVFPRAYENVAQECQVDRLVCVEGKIQKKDNELKIIAEQIDEIPSDTENLVKLEVKYHKISKENGSEPKLSEPDEPEPKTIETPPSPPLVLRLDHSSNKKTLEDIRQIVSQYPGNTPLVLEIPQNDEYQKVKTKTKIELSPELIAKLENLLPKTNILTPTLETD
ncbi:MAG: DNA polymerase III subunit alpha [bacterium]|nr:DNA polymerase III subunit alpha [bacterium]